MSALLATNPSLEERVCTVRRKLWLILAAAEHPDYNNEDGDLVDGIGETVREAIQLLDPIRLYALGEVLNWKLRVEEGP